MNKVAKGRPCYLGGRPHFRNSCFTIVGLKTEALILRSLTPHTHYIALTLSFDGQKLWF